MTAAHYKCQIKIVVLDILVICSMMYNDSGRGGGTTFEDVIYANKKNCLPLIILEMKLQESSFNKL